MGRIMNLLLLTVILLMSGCGRERYPVSEVIFEDRYALEGAENMDFIFSKDSTLVVRQRGIYELSKNASGDPVVRICLDDISRELPEDYNFTDYLIREENDHIALTYTSEEFDMDSGSMQLYLLEGEDGLRSDGMFDGIYQIGEDGDSYQYVFEKNGDITMQIEERYFADQEHMILVDHAGSTEYLYEQSEDKLILKNMKEEPILTLIRETIQ